MPWWMTWSVETWSYLFRMMKKNVSKNSVNLLKKYHQHPSAIFNNKGLRWIIQFTFIIESSTYLHCHWRSWSVNGLATIIVGWQPSGNARLIEEPTTEAHLSEVIQYQDVSEFEWFSVFHQFWSQNLKVNFCLTTRGRHAFHNVLVFPNFYIEQQ